MPEERKVSLEETAIVAGVVVFGTLAALAIFALTAAPPTPPPIVFTCPHCGAEFATEGELLAHIELEHPEVPPVVFICPSCGAEFATEGELLAHIELEHPEIPVPTITFTLSIKNAPEGAYGWSCVPPAAFHNWPGMYMHETWAISGPETMTIEVAIWDEELGAIIDRKEITGTFEDGGYYVLDYGASKFEGLTNIPTLVSFKEMSVPSYGEFWPEVLMYLPVPCADVGSTPAYAVRLSANGQALIEWTNILPPIGTFQMGELYLTEPDGLYLLKGIWGWTEYPYQWVNIPVKVTLPPGVYPVRAKITASNCISVTWEDYTYTSPQRSYDLGVVGYLTVTEGAPPELAYVPMPGPAVSAGTHYANWITSASEFAMPLDTSGFKDWLARYIVDAQGTVNSYWSQLAPYIRDGLVREDKYYIAKDYINYKAGLDGAQMAWQYFESLNWYR
ncbi:hypothetical protein ES703_108524 [subsurface metagenome]